MHELYFELIQVSINQLDCLSRGPSPEEWQEFYRLSKRHSLLEVTYQGVVKVFEFGLRAPQDLSIDWMADAEEIGESGQPEVTLQPADISNPIRRMLFKRWISRNGGSLYTYEGRQRQLTPQATAVLLLLSAYEQFQKGQLTLRPIVLLCQALQKPTVAQVRFQDGSTIRQMIKTFGILHFSQSVMWLLGHSLALDSKCMPCGMSSSGGRFVLNQVMETPYPFFKRLRNWLLRILY